MMGLFHLFHRPRDEETAEEALRSECHNDRCLLMRHYPACQIANAVERFSGARIIAA